MRKLFRCLVVIFLTINSVSKSYGETDFLASGVRALSLSVDRSDQQSFQWDSWLETMRPLYRSFDSRGLTPTGVSLFLSGTFQTCSHNLHKKVRSVFGVALGEEWVALKKGRRWTIARYHVTGVIAGPQAAEQLNASIGIAVIAGARTPRQYSGWFVGKEGPKLRGVSKRPTLFFGMDTSQIKDALTLTRAPVMALGFEVLTYGAHEVAPVQLLYYWLLNEWTLVE